MSKRSDDQEPNTEWSLAPSARVSGADPGVDAAPIGPESARAVLAAIEEGEVEDDVQRALA
jgi:hypothetical protein